MNSKIIFLLSIAAVAVWTANLQGSARCDEGSTDGTDVYGEWELTQNECAEADELSCQSYNEDVDIVGYFVTINRFDYTNCSFYSDRDVNIRTWSNDSTVGQGDKVTVKVTQYLDTEDEVCDNTMGMRHVQWECASRSARAMDSAIPAHRWRIERPVWDSDLGMYRHRLMILNDEDIDSNGRSADLAIANLMTVESDFALHVVSNGFNTSHVGTTGFFPVWDGVRDIDFDGTGTLYFDNVMFSGQRWTIDLPTPNAMYDGYVYLRFDIVDPLNPGQTLATVWGGHHVTLHGPLSFDHDGDGDVDLEDYSEFISAFTGPGIPLTVTSTPLTGAFISGSPTGHTDFVAQMPYNAQINMTAPDQVTGPGPTTYDFDRWYLNGIPLTEGAQTLQFRLNSPATADAAYVEDQ